MAHRRPVRTTTHRLPRACVAGLFVVLVAIVGVPGFRSLASSATRAASLTSSSVAAPTTDALPSEQRRALGEPDAAVPLGPPAGERAGALGEADGAVPDGTTVFDDDVPAVARLEPTLLGALRRAATDAAEDRIVFHVDSGWRSPAYQEHLLEQAISKYGSEKEAARWVATPTTSAHVSGEAVDIGPTGAAAWLSRHGAAYDLCQIYRNEPWHYELRPDAVDHGCPPMYADPTHDPRMQQ